MGLMIMNIFFSLQMPRQLTVRGSDGNAYRLMVKSDDTRKDAKVVEFTTMVNEYYPPVQRQENEDYRLLIILLYHFLIILVLLNLL